ncbi:MAG: 4-demethylwyosine synthase TYW1 [Thermoprotei archaeon]|nr:MAG: 4-demethylwyosine synthase TYW1 [Thermoprotei archaeon]
MITLSEKQISVLRRKHYGVVGRHSAVQICRWTKKSILGEGTCYKERFYGVHAHRCAQFSPVALWCNMNCIYCWRPMEWMKNYNIGYEDVEDPETIIRGVIEERRKLLIGFLGNPKASRSRVMEALEPDHYAISLSGEPTMYPRLDEMIKLLRDKYMARTIFLVTNGQVPEMLMKLEERKALPTQLYISVTAPNKELGIRIHKPVFRDFWERLLSSLRHMGELGGKTRRVIRLTLIKGYNMDESYMPEFTKLIRLANPDFVEVKAYMHLGLSTLRLARTNMPSHKEVRCYSERLVNNYLNEFKVEDEQVESRIVLLKNTSSKVPTKIYSDD